MACVTVDTASPAAFAIQTRPPPTDRRSGSRPAAVVASRRRSSSLSCSRRSSGVVVTQTAVVDGDVADPPLHGCLGDDPVRHGVDLADHAAFGARPEPAAANVSHSVCPLLTGPLGDAVRRCDRCAGRRGRRLSPSASHSEPSPKAMPIAVRRVDLEAAGSPTRRCRDGEDAGVAVFGHPDEAAADGDPAGVEPTAAAPCASRGASAGRSEASF